MLHKIRSVVFGHAVADAVGVPAEFRSRSSLKADPITDITEYGTYNMPMGCWSDDTTMALCALDVLADGEVDYDRIMKNFCEWYEAGEFTPTGVLFDIGGSCSRAISNYLHYGTPALKCGGKDEYSNGNGSLMRIYPFVLYAHYHGLSDKELLRLIKDGSSLTHAHALSVNSCTVYSFILRELLRAPSRDSVPVGIEAARKAVGKCAPLDRVLDGSIITADESSVKGDGYVVHSLEASVWCLMNTDSYRECVLRAVNLGDDTDTTAAIAGSLAGALYGCEAIPQHWLAPLKRADFIDEMCIRAANNLKDVTQMDKAPRKICDIHSHLAPDVDDGAVNLKMALEMAAMAQEQGVTDIICTSHSDAKMESYRRAMGLLSDSLAKSSTVRVYTGCEIYCSTFQMDDIVKGLDSGYIPTLNGTKYVLCEFSPYAFFDEIYACLGKLKDTGYLPILAHAERYFELHGDISPIRTLCGAGCLIQINAYSLADENDPHIKAYARELLREHLPSFIGSDAHRTTHRSYAMENGIAYVFSTCDKEYANALCYGNAARLLDIGSDT